jgi:amino acid transporter
VTTLAEEVPNPRKDIPFGVIVTLVIAGTLYIATSLVLTGMQPWYSLNADTPLASAFKDVGLDWAATIIAFCTVTALSVTTLCSLFGQPRIFYRMAKDGLLFPIFGQLTQKSQVPLWGTLFSGVCAGLIAFFLDISILADMISMGTLLAFSTVCGGIVILRVEPPENRPSSVLIALSSFVVLICLLSFSLRFIDVIPLGVTIPIAVFTALPVLYLARLRQRPVDSKLYSAPFVPYLPLLGIFFNVYLICSNTALSFYRLLVWTFLGCSLYFLYGRTNSRLGRSYTLLNHTE